MRRSSELLAERLRRWAAARDRRNPAGHGKTGTDLLADAADEIERLSWELEDWKRTAELLQSDLIEETS